MSISPDSPWRGAAALLSQPVSREDEAKVVVEAIDEYNVSSSVGTCLSAIEYRSSDGDIDVRRHVFRWDIAPYGFVFQEGFIPRRQAGIPDGLYYNLGYYHANSGRQRHLDTRSETEYAFISTTMSSSWFPPVDPGVLDEIYRYEIYAPGGILVAQTLDNKGCRIYPCEEEVVFPGGIAPQYIRSAQRFELRNERGNTTRRRVDNFIYINRKFNPQSHPTKQLRIQMPVSHYLDKNRNWAGLVTEIVPHTQDPDDDLIKYYKKEVTEVDNFIDSAFRCTRKNEAYVFMSGECVRMDYAPGSTNDRIVDRGPHFIGSRFKHLMGTAFAEYGIDAAFGCHGSNDEAVIFSANLCASISTVKLPTVRKEEFIDGPKTIRQMFNFFKGTRFEGGVDAAFESTTIGEAYLFKGPEYALINYSTKSLIAIRPIREGFKCFRNTIFERDIGAAFASHAKYQAYLFKDNSYVLFHFTPGDTKDYIIGGPKEIVPSNWPCLKQILPRKNRGLDILPNLRLEDHDDLQDDLYEQQCVQI